MLPFLKKDKEASASGPVESQMRKPDDEADSYDVMHSAAHDLIEAIHSKNVKGVAEALRAAHALNENDESEGED